MSAATLDKGKGKARDEGTPDNSLPLPHPAEDLSSDDDLLSWMLVDQLGGMPNSRLGVHPQENKFVGPKFKTEEVLDVIRETVVKGNPAAGMAQLQEHHLIQAHLRSKRTESQRERFIQHLRRYLLPYAPNSRVDIHTTDRYSHVTLHPELAVYATRPLAPGTVLQELQGSVVELPEEWRKEMDLSDDFIEARLAAGEESEDEDSEDEADEGDETPDRRGNDAGSSSGAGRAKGKGKEKEQEKGARRSGRTRRRDFSIVWSELKRCYQLFLGPARFLNHDCSPNVELLRQGKYVTFRVTRPVRIGEELATFYGADYFGPNNIECLCLSCERNQRGPYAVTKTTSTAPREGSVSSRSATPGTPAKVRTFKPSRLRESVLAKAEGKNAIDSEDGATVSDMPAETLGESSTAANPSVMVEDDSLAPVGSDVDELDSDQESDTSEPVQRERLSRVAKLNAKPIILHRRTLSAANSSAGSASPFGNNATPNPDDDLPEDFPRCATCAAALHERTWFGGRYFDHCPRCTRHAFIFDLPWPAHKGNEVQEYPPAHLIPPNYVPVRISTVPLPSLTKKRIMPVATVDPSIAEEGMLPVSKEYRAQLRLRKEIALEEFTVEALREAAWAVHVAYEESVETARQQVEARLEEKRLAREAKKARDAEKIKGSGVWSRYVYVTEEEFERQQQERNAVTLGTRRGGRYKREDMEGTPEREMREVREETRKQWDEEEKVVSKLRMESWKAEMPLESLVHGTPKKKRQSKIGLSPQAATESPVQTSRGKPGPRPKPRNSITTPAFTPLFTVKTKPTKAALSASRPVGRPAKSTPTNVGVFRKNSKAARMAQTAKASEARRKSMPNPSTSSSAFAAVIAATAAPSTAKAKGKRAKRAATESVLSDNDTISDVNDLIDTSRVRKKNAQARLSSPEKSETPQPRPRVRAAASGSKDKPQSSNAASAAKVAASKIVHAVGKVAGRTFLRLGPKTNAARISRRLKQAEAEDNEEEDAVTSPLSEVDDDASSQTSEALRRSVSAALQAIGSSNGTSPEQAEGSKDAQARMRRRQRSKWRTDDSDDDRSLSRLSVEEPEFVGKGKGKEKAQPLPRLTKRKARESDAIAADGTGTASSSLSPALDNDYDDDATTGKAAASRDSDSPPAKRRPGRPKGSGYLQKRAAAAAARETSIQSGSASQVPEASSSSLRIRDKGKGKEKAREDEEDNNENGQSSGEASGSVDPDSSGILGDGSVTAATFVSDNVPTASEDHEMEVDMDIVDDTQDQPNSSTSAAPAASGRSRTHAAPASMPQHIDPVVTRTAAEPDLDAMSVPSRTPSPFLRRPPPASVRNAGSGPGIVPAPVPFHAPVRTAGPAPGASHASNNFSTLRIEHYDPHAPKPARRRKSEAASSVASAGPTVRRAAAANKEGKDKEKHEGRKGRKYNVNYSSHRQLIEKTLGNVTLQPDHRTPVNQTVGHTNKKTSTSPGAAEGSAFAQTEGAASGSVSAGPRPKKPSPRRPRVYVPRTAIPYSASH